VEVEQEGLKAGHNLKNLKTAKQRLRAGSLRRGCRLAQCNRAVSYQFRVNDTFALERRGWFVLAGPIAEGQIRVGMIVNVPLNSSSLSHDKFKALNSPEERMDVRMSAFALPVKAPTS
jgi:hypothetical protein